MTTPTTDPADTPDATISVWMNDDGTIKMAIDDITGKVGGSPIHLEFLIPSVDALGALAANGPAGLSGALERGDLIPIALNEDENEAWRGML
jgi:hypothetical protein